MARYIVAVVDLQFGSTGKGQIAGTLAHHWKADAVATAWGPNAGHTFRMGERTFVSRMLASSAVAPSVKNILIGPGSVVDLPQLALEIDAAQDLLRGKHLVIHPQAAILGALDATNEAHLMRIGSTMKGTAEAMKRKIDRNSSAVATGKYEEVYAKLARAVTDAGMSLAVSSAHYDWAVESAQRLMLEGAQGFSLGIHTDFFPFTTSRDVSTAQLFADCRIPWPSLGGGARSHVHVVGVARTYPIRVANRFDKYGEKIGTSGGHYSDQKEIEWADIGRDPELTTVTKLPRRIFTFSKQQIHDAVRVCGPSSIALTFCDYMGGGEVAALIDKIGEVSYGVPVKLCSYGPTTDNVMRRLLPTDELKPVLETQPDWLMGW